MKPKGGRLAHDHLCKAIRDLLLYHGIPAWRVGQKGSQRRDGSWYAGHDNGAPDVFAILPAEDKQTLGRALLIECKTGRPKLSPEQEDAKDQCEAAGGIWITATSAPQVLGVLEELGLA